jgi:hypothetical protein
MPGAKKVGILAYGSLIPFPGSEIEGATVDRKPNVRTPFNVEFARSSKCRSGAPTLVPVSDGGEQVNATIFEVNLPKEEAMNILYRREINKVGSARRYEPLSEKGENAVKIDCLENFEGFDVVLSTRIGANITPLTASELAARAIKSARERDDGRDGISYLLDAKRHGIKTPLSEAYETEIKRRLDAPNLEEALEKARA